MAFPIFAKSTNFADFRITKFCGNLKLSGNFFFSLKMVVKIIDENFRFPQDIRETIGVFQTSSCVGRPVFSVLFRIPTGPACPVLPVSNVLSPLSGSSSPAKAVLPLVSWQGCPCLSCSVPAAPPQLPRSGILVYNSLDAAVMSWYTYSLWPLSRLACPLSRLILGRPVQTDLSRLTYTSGPVSRCPIPTVLPQRSRLGCPVLVFPCPCCHVRLSVPTYT